MKTNKIFGFAVMILLMVSCAVFGQYQYRNIGSDHLNPDLDPLLMAHAWYAQSSINGSGYGYSLPANGITGTSGSFNLDGPLTIGAPDICEPEATPAARLQKINRTGNITVSMNAHLYYNTNNGRAISGPNTQVENVYRNVVVDGSAYNRDPELPDFNSIVFPGSLTALNGGSSCPSCKWEKTLEPGVHYYSSIILGNGSKLNIKPGKTIIYVSGNISDDGNNNEIRYVKEDGVTPLTDSEFCDVEDYDLLFIVGGNVTFQSGSTKAVGSFIAPKGTISTGSGSIAYNGQILAVNLSFATKYEAATQMRFKPFPIITDPLKIEPSNLTFEREQCGTSYNAVITIALPQVLKGTQSISFDYEIKPKGTPLASVGPAGTDAKITSDKMKGTIVFTVASQEPFEIPLEICNDGKSFYENKAFDIQFSNMIYSDIKMELPEPAEMKINMTGAEQKKPVTPDIIQSATGPVESFTPVLNSRITNLQSDWTGTGAGQIVAVLPNETGITYKITHDYPNSTTPWFAVDNANKRIVTTSHYAADYENTTHRNNGFLIKYAAVKMSNLDCVREGEPKNLTIYPRPWNDNAFVKKNVTKSIAERGNVGIAVSDWFVRDGDELVADNKQRVISYKNGPTVTGATVTVSSDGQTVTYSQAGVTEKVCQTTDKFTIIVRDSAAYGYPTDTFDEEVLVTVNITPGNFFNPEPQLQQIELCKYDTRTISGVMVIDNDNCNRIAVSSNSFTGTPTADLATDGSSVSIVGGKLVYHAPTNLNFVADPTKYQDTIRYTVTDGVNTGNGKIAVKINPVKDKKPTGDNIEITAVLGTPREVTVSDLANWTNNNVPLPANLVVEGNAGDIYTLNPTAASFDVQLLDPVTGKFVITSPSGSTDETSRIFKYVIIDTQTSDCSAFDRNKVSDSIIVKINFEKPKETAVEPGAGTIIAIQNRDTTKLFDDITESLWDLVPTNEKGYFVTEVKIGDYSPLQGSIDIQPDGKFTYSPGLGFAATDRFSYKALSNAGNWSQIDGNIKVYINLRNLNEPDLSVGKVDTVNALETKNIRVIDNSDSDKDILTTLKLDNTKNPAADNSNAEVSIAGDSSIVFKYLDKEFLDTIDVEVTFWVTDSVNYTEYFYNDGVLDSTRYTEFDSYPNTIIVTVLPNAEAVNDSMTVKELQSTNEFVETDGTKYFKVTDNDLFLENVKSYRVALKDSATAGKIELNSDGTAIYTHQDSEKLYDTFSYYLISTISDDSKDTTVGIVVISISPRAPRPSDVPSFYEDKNADGMADKITISFDRAITDLENTEFDVIFGTDTTKKVKAEYADAEKKTVILTEFKAAQDKTGGLMEVNVMHKNFPDEETQKISPVEDRTAPVIAKAIYTRVLGGKDTLLITMSEYCEINNDQIIPPFLFVNAKGILFEDVVDNGNRTYTAILTKESSGKIDTEEWIYVNDKSAVADIVAGVVKNTQNNPENKRVPIITNVVSKITSAVYLDLPNEKGEYDGFIDLIKISLGTEKEIDVEFAETVADALVLSLNRNFTKGEVTVTKTGFDLNVAETKRADGAKTDLYEDDLVSIAADLTFKNITIQAGGVKVKDEVAPVILYAEYSVKTPNYLDVVFSEPVSVENGNPYKFLQTGSGNNYDMTFESQSKPVNTAENILRYNVSDAGVPYPVAGDSIWIYKDRIVGDLESTVNMQSLTVRAPLKLIGKYDRGLEFFVVPNPLYLIQAGKGQEAKELPKSLMDYYEIPQSMNKGAALIVEAKGPITNKENIKGFVKIFDQTGNAVSDEIQLTSVLTKNGMNGVAVWDGKNKSGRNVGSSTYLAIVQVEVKFDDSEIKETYLYKKIIAVTTAAKLFQ